MSDVIMVDFGGLPPPQSEEQSAQVRLIPSRTTVGFIVGEVIAMGISIPFGVKFGNYDPAGVVVTFSILMCIWLRYKNISWLFTSTLIREVIANALFCFWWEIPLIKLEMFAPNSGLELHEVIGAMISIPVVFYITLRLVRYCRITMLRFLPTFQRIWDGMTPF